MNLFTQKSRCILTVLFLSLCFVVKAQDNTLKTKVSLDLKTATLQEVFSNLGNQTNYNFSYGEFILNNPKTFTVSHTNELLSNVLTSLGKRANFDYYVTNKVIVITPAKQEKTLPKIEGKIIDEAGFPIVGATVVVKGTTQGASTDIDGKFILKNVSPTSMISISYIGYAPMLLNANSNLSNIILKEDSQMLDEVVVTALGIKRQEKALSYNVQKVKAGEITAVKDANFINSLSGKVAGVTINRSSSGVGGATKVVMRGVKSIEKSNNALYIIDGVPMSSTSSPQGVGQFQSAGSTEGIADINPEDIESITILTGASAAALYGSSAANGAVLITTKKGKEGKINVAFSSSVEVADPLLLPQIQNTYGNDGKIQSWGAKLTENIERHNAKDFFQTANTYINSLSLSGGTKKNQTYFSLASTNSEGIVPSNNYNRYNFTFRNTTSLLQDRLKLDFSASYISQKNQNMINQGEYMNPLVGVYLMPRGYGLSRAKVFEKYNPSNKIYEQIWGDFSGTNGLFGGTFSGDFTIQNPYWVTYRNLRETERERNMISLGATYDIKQWSESEKWDISARIRTDNTHYKSTDKRYASTIAVLDMSKTGYFGLSKGVEKQAYLDILSNIKKDYIWEGVGDFSLIANIGASLQDNHKDGSFYKGPLRSNGIPNVFNSFNIDQSAQKTIGGEEGWKEQTQSIFGSVEVGYNNYLYLTLTGRNDWASQLANSPNSSFFYPSIGLSAIVTEMLPDKIRSNLRNYLSFMKVRLAFSSVGSPFDRWLTSPMYEFNEDTKTWNSVSHFPIGSLYPEKTNSYEVGLASKWFNGSLDLDLTFYKTNTYNQTIRSEISASTGYDAIYLQTGDVQNQGLEVGLGYKLKTNNSKFSWNTYFTMGYNKNKIKSLLENYVNPVTGVSESKDFLVKNGLGPLNYVLKTGGTLGDIYTNADFKRDLDGNIVIDEKGNIAIENFAKGKMEKIGSVLPDYNMGWRNDFTFMNFSLGAMISGRIGGVAVSMTEAALDYYGVSQRTADARDIGGIEINGLTVNTQNYYTVRGKNRLPQYYTYSATNFRLQEAYISYRIPREKLKGTLDLTLSLVGNNLVMLYNKAPFDPETISSTGNYVQGLDYFMMPSLRSFGLNLKANF